MTFDDVRAESLQEFELHRDPSGLLEYPTKYGVKPRLIGHGHGLVFIRFLLLQRRVVNFSSVSHLTIHFPTNFGTDVTQLCYIGLRGEWTAAQRQEIAITNYELRANLADHPNRIWDQVSREVQ
jgi:hypothetical protein